MYTTNMNDFQQILRSFNVRIWWQYITLDGHARDPIHHSNNTLHVRFSVCGWAFEPLKCCSYQFIIHTWSTLFEQHRKWIQVFPFSAQQEREKKSCSFWVNDNEIMRNIQWPKVFFPDAIKQLKYFFSHWIGWKRSSVILTLLPSMKQQSLHLPRKKFMKRSEKNAIRIFCRIFELFFYFLPFSNFSIYNKNIKLDFVVVLILSIFLRCKCVCLLLSVLLNGVNWLLPMLIIAKNVHLIH